jgi:flagellar biogenesis protein FliO
MKNSLRPICVRTTVSCCAVLLAPAAFASATNSVPVLAPMPELGPALVRVFGALILVLALFLGGVWFFRNWQRFAVHRGRAPKLDVLEVRSLGGRHAIYVVGYEHERLLLASGPTGVSFLSPLPPADEDSVKETEQKPAASSFSAALAKVLKGK